MAAAAATDVEGTAALSSEQKLTGESSKFPKHILLCVRVRRHLTLSIVYHLSSKQGDASHYNSPDAQYIGMT